MRCRKGASDLLGDMEGALPTSWETPRDLLGGSRIRVSGAASVDATFKAKPKPEAQEDREAQKWCGPR